MTQTDVQRPAPASQIVCHECDLLNDVPELAVGQKAYCIRCNYLLAAHRPHAQDTIFAFSLTALLFLTLASLFPFLGFSARGQEQNVTLIDSVAILLAEDFTALAFVVFATIIAVPALFLFGVIYVSAALMLGRELPGTRRMLRGVLLLLPWSMAEIFLIGILVSFIKIVSLADVTLGLSFWSYALFTLCMIVVMLHIDKRQLWRGVGALADA